MTDSGQQSAAQISDWGLRVVSGSAELTVEALSRTIADLEFGRNAVDFQFEIRNRKFEITRLARADSWQQTAKLL
jgi:hypothetical protein